MQVFACLPTGAPEAGIACALGGFVKFQALCRTAKPLGSSHQTGSSRHSHAFRIVSNCGWTPSCCSFLRFAPLPRSNKLRTSHQFGIPAEIGYNAKCMGVSTGARLVWNPQWPSCPTKHRQRNKTHLGREPQPKMSRGANTQHIIPSWDPNRTWIQCIKHGSVDWSQLGL